MDDRGRDGIRTVVIPDDGLPYLVTQDGTFPSYDPRYNPGPYLTARETVGLSLVTLLLGSAGVVALRRLVRRLR